MNDAFGWTRGQYTLFRVLFGAYLCVHFLTVLPWTTELFSSAGMLPEGALSPAFGVPNLLWLTDAPGAVHLLVASGAVAAVLFALGRCDRVAAVWMWLVLVALLARNPLIANPGMPYVGWMLLAHLFVPASRRTHARDVVSAGNATSPVFVAVVAASWVVLALTYTYSGYTKLFSATWLSGDAVAVVLDNPLARDWWLRDVVAALPAQLLALLTWFILWVEVLYAPLFVFRRLRLALWASMLLVQVGFLLLLKFPDLTTPMLLMHVLASEPRWFDRRRALPITLYYDGYCGLCHRVVQFALAEDRRALVHFAPLQGDAAQQPEIQATQRAGDTFVVALPDGSLRVRSAALIVLLDTLGGWWRPLAMLLRCVPGALRDRVYDVVGARRLALFGRAPELCPVVPAELRQRFLVDARVPGADARSTPVPTSAAAS